MDSPLAFFSFVSLAGGDREAHTAYNEWHQLDHRPENLALPGVAWGDRWARLREPAEGAVSSDQFDGTDYVAMYWFRDPVDDSVAAWDHLGADSLEWGRGPLIPGVERELLAFFRPIKGYVAPSALVGTSALPYRPNRGVQVTLRRFAEPHGAGAHDHHRWEDRVLMPSLMDVDGVAGGWTFSFSHHQQHSSLPFASARSDPAGALRISLLYLDGEPGETTARIAAATEDLARRGGGEPPVDGEVLFRSTLTTIVPWLDW